MQNHDTTGHSRRSLLASVGAIALLPTLPPFETRDEWLAVLSQFEMHENGPAAAMHARRLGLTLADFQGISFWVRDADPRDLPRLHFFADEDFQCFVSPTRCHLTFYAPGKTVSFDRLGNPQFGEAR